MYIEQNKLWTWILPDNKRDIRSSEWASHGGKWIVFDSRDRIVNLAEQLGSYIDAGEIECAKYWNGDPSAINVYSLDREREKSQLILQRLGSRRCMVWEYDYAWRKNMIRPIDFLYSWSSKFRTILRSYGIRGTLDLIRDVFFS